MIDEPAQLLWNQGRPIIRRMELGEDECVAVAVNAYQKDNEKSPVEISCGGRKFRVPTEGRRVTLVHIKGDRVTLH